MMNDNGNGAGLKIPPPGEERREWIRYRLRKLKGPKGKRLTSADIARTTGAGESTVSLVFLGRRVDGDKAASVREHTAKLLEIPEATLFPEILTINAAHAVACPKCGHEFDPDNPLASLLDAVDAGEQESGAIPDQGPGDGSEVPLEALAPAEAPGFRIGADDEIAAHAEQGPRDLEEVEEEFEDLDAEAQREVRALEDADAGPSISDRIAAESLDEGGAHPFHDDDAREATDTCGRCEGTCEEPGEDGKACTACKGDGEVPASSPYAMSRQLPAE
jgi:transcriptional regulator with XRE-family HTH domain